MQKPDEIKLTFDQNPALAEAFKDTRLGEKVELELHGTLKSKDAEGVYLTVEAAVPEGFELADEDEAGEMPPPAAPSMGSPTYPMMTPTAMLVRRKGM